MRKPYDRTLKQVLTKELKSRDPEAQISIDYPVSQEGFTIDLVFKSSTRLAKQKGILMTFANLTYCWGKANPFHERKCT